MKERSAVRLSRSEQRELRGLPHSGLQPGAYGAASLGPTAAVRAVSAFAQAVWNGPCTNEPAPAKRRGSMPCSGNASWRWSVVRHLPGERVGRCVY